MAELAVRNLRESMLRNSLTTVGISVGVASLVAMLSSGHRAAAIGWPAPGEVRTVRHRRRHLAPRSAQFRTRAGTKAALRRPRVRMLDEPARQEIERLPDVLEAYPGHPLHHRAALRRQTAHDHGGGPACFRPSPMMHFEGMQGVLHFRNRAGGHPAEIICRRIAGQNSEDRCG